MTTATRRPSPPSSRRPRRARPAPLRAAAGLRGHPVARRAATVLGRLSGLRVLVADRLLACLAVLSVALVAAFALLIGSTGPVAGGEQVPLSTVQGMVNQRQVASATLLDDDHRLIVTTRSGATHWAALPSGAGAADALVRALSDPAAGATLTVDGQRGKQTRRLVGQVLLPILILVSLFAFFMRLGQAGDGGGVGAFSRWRGSKATVDPGSAPRFSGIAGAGTAITELRELCELLRAPDRYRRLGARPPKGALLVGPPGTGKTLLARATATEAGASFYAVSGAEFVESLVGVGAARIRDLFSKARENAPAIVFIDEIDAVGRKRGAGVGQGNDEREQTLNQLLVEMDGFDAGGGLVVLAATNRPDVLDPALLRPGRFDRQVTVDAPDLRGRVDILRLYLRGRPVAGDVDLTDVARRCPGFTGAELANAVNEAALLAARASRPSIGMPDLAEGIERTVSGARNQAHVLSGDEQRTIAVHEAGHAVVAAACGRADAVHSVSIVARGRRLGRATTLLLDKDRTVLRRSDLERQLMVTLAGTAAENVAFGEMSTAVNDDLHTATQLARSMVTSYGMSDLGPVTIGERSPEVFLGAALQELDSVGNATRERIDAETRRIVEESSARAQAVLR
ncbi:MAG: ATP-dependent zinc metalloprotease FtsH, partial [Thermoleophilia bacterium]|nr:ATP-dependent zinc metalloprotease FtsH [Thermoleophilia bacterium]